MPNSSLSLFYLMNEHSNERIRNIYPGMYTDTNTALEESIQERITESINDRTEEHSTLIKTYH